MMVTASALDLLGQDELSAPRDTEAVNRAAMINQQLPVSALAASYCSAHSQSAEA